MDQLLLQVGVGGIFAILVLDKVFQFLEKHNRKGGAALQPPGFCPAISTEERVLPVLREIHKWLSAEDQDGVKKIYNNRRHLEKGLDKMIESIDSLSKSVHEQNIVLRGVVETQDKIVQHQIEKIEQLSVKIKMIKEDTDNLLKLQREQKKTGTEG